MRKVKGIKKIRAIYDPKTSFEKRIKMILPSWAKLKNRLHKNPHPLQEEYKHFLMWGFLPKKRN